MAFNPIHVIFGLKLRQARLEKGLSLTELAERSQLSPSYITEIEKGRKYPKADKILRLAQALGYDYDELVSRRLDPPLSFLESSLTSQLLQDFPLEMFGVDPAVVVELLTRSPAEMSALLQALQDVARGYNIREEHLYRAALRSYQEYHTNYFQDLEDAAAAYRARLGLEPDAAPSEEVLLSLLRNDFGCQTGVIPVDSRPSLAAYRAIFVPGRSPRLLLNAELFPSQRKFVIAREIGYRVLELEERSYTHPPGQTESFTQVLNDFKAAYFAGALLLPKDALIERMRSLFDQERWNPRMLLDMLAAYDVTPETLLYRFSELAPRFFGLKVHFLRFNEVQGAYRLYKQLNMNELSLPTGFNLREHYCRRWLTVRLLRELAVSGGPGPIVGIQRSRFLQSRKEFLCLGMARQDNLPPYHRTSVILGIRCDEDLAAAVRFARDPSIPQGLLNETCERCPLSEDECSERAAPPTRWLEQQAALERQRDLEALLNEGASMAG